MISDATIQTGITTLGTVAIAWIAYLQVKAQRKLKRLDAENKAAAHRIEECETRICDIQTQAGSNEPTP